MKRGIGISALLLASALPAVAHAQQAPAAPAVAPATPAAPDATRLALARLVVGQIVPPGTYRELMRDFFAKSVPGMMEGIADIPIPELAASLGVPAEALAKLDKGRLGEIADLVDPLWKERVARMLQVFGDLMDPMFDLMEPRVREGLAQAYANAFTADELRAIDRFFTTPAGGHFARESLRGWTDPAVMKAVMRGLPDMIQSMRTKAVDLPAKLLAATSSLPPPRSESSMTEAERARLKELLGPLGELFAGKPEQTITVPEPNSGPGFVPPAVPQGARAPQTELVPPVTSVQPPVPVPSPTPAPKP